MCFIEQLFTQLLFHPPTQKELHVSSPLKLRYRNKITYSCVQECTQGSVESKPIRHCGSRVPCWKFDVCKTAPISAEKTSNSPIEQQDQKQTVILHYSNLAEDYINNICCSIVEFWRTHIDGKQSYVTVSSNISVLLREIMVKGTRSTHSIIIRLTLQFFDGQQNLCLSHDPSTNSSLTWKDGAIFYNFIAERYKEKEFCICYNSMIQDNVRPKKDQTQLHFITPQMPHVLEYTPNGYIYQISPDTFSEVNHEVEMLQWNQTKNWVEEMFLQLAVSNRSTGENCGDFYNDVTLIVSGRDISSFALGFGTLRNPKDSCPQRESSCNDIHGKFMFQNVIAVQHCPLVHFDAVQNIQRYLSEHGAIPNFEVLHCSKASMVHEIDKILRQLHCRNPCSLFSVMTGGRKGLDPSYVNFLNHHPSMKGIVYNSCATKSLVRDMKGFILHGSFYIDNFRSYDFLPNTSYTASLTKLIRRPRTLIILIGPAGVGKSSFARQLVQQYDGSHSCNSVIWWERDRIFAALRMNGIGLNKAKQMVHQDLLNVLRRKENAEASSMAELGDEQNDGLYSDCNAVIIVDSTNGNLDARKLFVQEASPDLVIYVSFQIETKLSSSHDADNKEQILSFLMRRTERRLYDNLDQHPSFPKTVNEQRMKHLNILSGIVYPTSDEMTTLNVKRSVLITCDPQDAECMASLPYKVFLEYSTSAEIRKALSL